jgi:WD40 repeat protein
VWPLDDPSASRPAWSLPGAVTLAWHPLGDGAVIMTPEHAVEYWRQGATEPVWSQPGFRIGWQPPTILFASDGTEIVVPQMQPAEGQSERAGLRMLSVADGTQTGVEAPLRGNFDDWFWLDETERHVGMTARSDRPMTTFDFRNGGGVETPFRPPSTASSIEFSEALDAWVVAGPLGIALHDPSWGGPLERRLPIADRDEIDFRGGPGTGNDIEGEPLHWQSLSGDGQRLIVSTFDLPALAWEEIEQYDLTESRPRPVDPDPRGLYSGMNGHHVYVGPAFGPPSPDPAQPLLAGGATMLADNLEPVGETVPYDGRFPTSFDPSPDGRFFVARWFRTASDGELVLHGADGSTVASLDVRGRDGNYFSFTDDSRRLVTQYGDEWVMWDPNAGEIIDEGPRPGAEFTHPWLAGDTLYAAGPPDSGLPTHSIQRLDPESYEPVGDPLIGHRNSVAMILDNANNDLIVTKSITGTVRLWDRETGEQIGRTMRDWFGSPPRSLTMSTDGTVLTQLNGAYVGVWDFDVDNWPNIACEFAGRNMTAEEWDDFGPQTIEYRATCPAYPLEM